MNNKMLATIKKDLIYAIIPARSGSKGVPNKNIKIVGGYPIIAYSIAAAKLVKSINRIIVSTDSSEYADIAVFYGAEVPVLRPADISQDKSSDFEFMEHIINWLYDNESVLPAYFVHLRPTTPLRESDCIEQAINIIRMDEKATSLRSAHGFAISPYKWFLRDDEGYLHTLTQEISLDDANDPRQIFPQIYIPDGYVDVLKTENIIKNDRIHGNKMIGFESPPDLVDIDVKGDIEKLEKTIAGSNSDVFDFLKENYERISL